jgi:hypothetical protein
MEAPMKSTRKKSGRKKPPRNAARRVKLSALRRKNLILDQVKIDRAKKILGVATETEAITRALDAVNDLAIFRWEVDQGLDELIGGGGFSDHFGSTAP